MQTILGSGGAIGFELAKALKNYTGAIRLVSRNPKKVNPEDELFPADLTRQEDVSKAIAGSDIVYLVVGFEYKLKVWQKNWPELMRNVIHACKEHKSRLVFFDNVYMYKISSIPHMTEDAPIHPPSRKGAVRAEISQMIMREVESGKLEALIARAADFIGPEKQPAG
ncbi:MAG: NAD-dependent epimerase/dehydratase family protein [Bacteroidota bacterium]|nr:NAD-dependent epimerase/dehydratase family protein [Bacteroidota bacterium]